MAGERKITVTFDGKDVGLSSAVDKAESSLGGVERQSRVTREGFDSMGEGADTAEQRFIGVADTFTGVQDTMSGWSQVASGDVAGGLLTMTMGFADLASGMSNLIAPVAGHVAAWVTGNTTMAASSVGAAAAEEASWISVGLTSLASAAQVALAWLISIGPVLIVIAVIVGLVILIIKNWDTIKSVIRAGWQFVQSITSSIWAEIKALVSGAIAAVITNVTSLKDGVMGVINAMKSAIGIVMGGLADTLTAPFRNAFGAIKSIWNSTVGGKGFSVPDWVPGIGGKSFKIPMLADGGIITRPMLIGAGEAGPEAIVPLGRAGAGLGGPTVIEIRSGGTALDDLLVELLRRSIRARGSSVQAVLG
jgi:hypothetical protein